MKSKYLKTIGEFPPIRIAVPAMRIRKRRRVTQKASQKRDDLMSVFRDDLATLIEQRRGHRECSRPM